MALLRWVTLFENRPSEAFAPSISRRMRLLLTTSSTAAGSGVSLPEIASMALPSVTINTVLPAIFTLSLSSASISRTSSGSGWFTAAARALIRSSFSPTAMAKADSTVSACAMLDVNASANERATTAALRIALRSLAFRFIAWMPLARWERLDRGGCLLAKHVEVEPRTHSQGKQKNAGATTLSSSARHNEDSVTSCFRPGLGQVPNGVTTRVICRPARPFSCRCRQ